MLSPEYLDDVSERLVFLFGRLQANIEADMARRISECRFKSATAKRQKEKLQEMLWFRISLRARLREALRKIDDELKETLKKSAKISIEADDKIFKAGLKKVPAKAEWINQIINKGYSQTREKIKNFCNSMGNVAVLELGKHLDLAYVEIKSGGFTAEQAISQAVNSLAREGIHSIEYGSGENISIEAGVRRAVLSGINKTVCDVSLKRAGELCVDLVKTTEHLGARPEHAVWQGRVFSLSGNGKYPDFYEETGYGEIEGLGGSKLSAFVLSVF
jgi:hypothetical protein